MLPHQGSGAGQAIEDAYILASLLADPNTTKETLPIALGVYDRVRRPQGTDIQERSRASERLSNFVFDGPGPGIITDEDLKHLADPALGGVHLREKGGTDDYAIRRLWEIRDLTKSTWEWAWETEPGGDRDRALRILGEEMRGTHTYFCP